MHIQDSVFTLRSSLSFVAQIFHNNFFYWLYLEKITALPSTLLKLKFLDFICIPSSVNSLAKCSSQFHWAYFPLITSCQRQLTIAIQAHSKNLALQSICLKSQVYMYIIWLPCYHRGHFIFIILLEAQCMTFLNWG